MARKAPLETFQGAYEVYCSSVHFKDTTKYISDFLSTQQQEEADSRSNRVRVPQCIIATCGLAYLVGGVCTIFQTFAHYSIE